MQSKATTVAAYLAELSPDRREAIQAVRKTILKNLDKDYAEGMSYGMIGYYVPHSVFPPGYHCDPKLPLPFAGLASQKGHMSVYLMSAYGDNGEYGWIAEQYKKAGKKLDMGKCCIRFKKLEDLPLDVIGEAIRRVPATAYIERYEQAMASMGKPVAVKGASAKRPKKTKSPASTKSAAKKPSPSAASKRGSSTKKKK